MRVLAWRTVSEYIRTHASAESSMREWFKLCERGDWSNFAELRATFNSVDAVGNKVIFNLGGNNHRIICRISFPYRRMHVLWIGTHAEYDRLEEKDIRNL